MVRYLCGVASCAALLLSFTPLGARAQAAPSAASAASAKPAELTAFVKGADVRDGMLPIVSKNGKIFLEVATSQLGQDFIETAIPATGLGGFGPAPGEPYVAPARMLRFERIGDTVVLRYPNAFALTGSNAPAADGVAQSLPDSVVAVVPIVAEDANHVLISADPFLGDVADLAASFRALSPNPAHGYALDPHRAFFVAAKAFAKNDVLRVDQTWESRDPATIDNAPDARSVEVKMTYNIIAAPHDGFVPRVYDPRVGYFSQPLLDFATDDVLRRDVHYITRWNFGPRDSAAPVHAQNPIVFYLSNDIPVEYRQTVKDALLTWNAAFEKIGILDAVEVKQQPSDPAWDPDDIQHNMVRWIDTSKPQYGAEALIVDDPRSGEELNVGVNFDAVEGPGGRLTYKYLIAPARGLPDSKAAEAAFAQELVRSVILHESGHDLGLQHNFIASEAYTAKDLQSKAFTQKYGVANSVMEYSPTNLWPKGTPQGDYDQLVLGPYDYYAVNYGYGYIPASASPAQVRATLAHWASRWNEPYYRFASDEDAQGFASGHSVDPRVVTDDLTNHPLAWCATQMTMLHGELDNLGARFPEAGMPYDEARAAFAVPMRWYLHCATMPAHTIGGEYLSRAVKGEPGSAPPLSPVSRGEERAAWNRLSDWLFADAPWRFKPSVLDMLTYSEVSSLSVDAQWAYNPTPRHDVPVVETVGAAQLATLRELFSPLRLQRIDEMALTFGPGKTMSLTDLFDWSQASIVGSIASGKATSDGVVRRNLQVMYAKFLGDMLTAPKPGTPSDAQALARANLEQLRHDATVASRDGKLDALTRAHLEELASIADQALSARAVIAAPMPHAPGQP
ncbi:MAG: zinc-dependent metalloprotease [bacterium]|nr:zinc-dependent metalloprotease [bacterium]